MALKESSLSLMGKALSNHLAKALSNEVRVLLGAPYDAKAISDPDDHVLNMFFFRFEPSGFYADASQNDIGFLRVHCIFTPFTVDKGVEGSAGENDLKLIGEVIRIFNESPVFTLEIGEQDLTNEFHIQVVFLTFGLDQLNQLWSTQNETGYRPSVVYEISLIPVIPNKKRIPSPSVGEIGVVVDAPKLVLPELTPNSGFAGIINFDSMDINVGIHDWSPVICLVREDECHHHLILKASKDLTFKKIIVRAKGKADEALSFIWNSWNQDSGWSNNVHTDTETLRNGSTNSQSGVVVKDFQFELPTGAERNIQLSVIAVRTSSEGARHQSNMLLISIPGEAT